jgi:hypothetical protein
MKYSNSTLNNIRAEILADTKKFLQCLESSASVEELSVILAEIKEKEAELFKAEGSMMAPDLWKLLYNRLASRITRDFPKQMD